MSQAELIASYPRRAWASTLGGLAPETPISEVYKCIKAPVQQPARGGQSMLTVDLYDVTGHLAVRIFPEHFADCKDLKPGITVHLDGVLRRGEHGWWVVAKRIVPAPIEVIEMVTPVAYNPIEDMETVLEICTGLVDPKSPYWRILVLFMDDEGWRDGMRLAAKSDFFPLSYAGGVLERTVKRTKIVLAKCEGDPKLRKDLLITASILGDSGLLETFEREDGMTVRSLKGRTDHEAILARDMIRAWVLEHDQKLKAGEEPIGIDSKPVCAVIHCILGLHGKEFLPKGMFGIREAQVLYNIQNL